VRVTEPQGAWLFAPTGKTEAVSLVLCPGGGVDPLAYAPLARRVAESGFRAFVVRFEPPRGRTVEEMKRDGVALLKALLNGGTVTEGRAVVAGHSLGGAIAARFAREHPGLVTGLGLAGTTHPRDFDLSGFKGPVTKIYGTLDGVAPPVPTLKNRALLPAHTRWVSVEGGNHAQFGWYGAQPGDRSAAISRQEQQAILLRELIALLKKGRAAGAVEPRRIFRGRSARPVSAPGRGGIYASEPNRTIESDSRRRTTE